MNPKKKYVSFGMLAVLYLLLIIVLPFDQVTSDLYHLTDSQYRIFLALISIPVVIAWFAAFYGYAALEGYASRIKRTAEGDAYMQLSKGLRWLAWGTPIIAIMSAVLGGIVSDHHHFFHAAVILKHYALVIVGLVTFTYTSYGSSRLLALLKGKPAIRSNRLLMLLFAALAIAYTTRVLTTLQHAGNGPYFMPDWVVLFTIVAPVLYGWFMAILTVYELFIYSKHAKGLLYKRALLLLYGGISTIVISSSLLEFILLRTMHLRSIILNTSFVIGYIALLLFAIGFVLVAVGGQRLKRIEEV